MACRTAPAVPRLLLIGDDPAWHAAVGMACQELGAELEVIGAMPGAIGRLLQNDAGFSHVLLCGLCSEPELDAIRGLLGEAAEPPVMLRLGGPDVPRDRQQRVAEPHSDRVLCALRRPARPSPALPPLLAEDVADSLRSGGLRLLLQPMLRGRDLVPVGIEALARVTHSSRGTLHPRDFLPLAARSGQERVLTGIVARQLSLELRGGFLGDDLFLSVNLPLSGLLNLPSVGRGIDLCAMAGIAPGRVVLEVLETTLLPDMAGMGRAMDAWRLAGFRLAMDDAGPALPHWRQLMDLPFDVVKLDGAMVARAEADAQTARIVDAAKQRGHEVVAEGIETEARLARMREFGVDTVQGFLFARPMPAMALPVWLRQRAAAARLAA
jgi:EAL domain-containing protein (putative c-di-GMP-specific phosphodiesterase class I)